MTTIQNGTSLQNPFETNDGKFSMALEIDKVLVGLEKINNSNFTKKHLMHADVASDVEDRRSVRTDLSSTIRQLRYILSNKNFQSYTIAHDSMLYKNLNNSLNSLVDLINTEPFRAIEWNNTRGGRFEHSEPVWVFNKQPNEFSKSQLDKAKRAISAANQNLSLAIESESLSLVHDALDSEDSFAHYGVKGMKWGIRKDQVRRALVGDTKTGSKAGDKILSKVQTRRAAGEEKSFENRAFSKRTYTKVYNRPP